MGHNLRAVFAGLSLLGLLAMGAVAIVVPAASAAQTPGSGWSSPVRGWQGQQVGALSCPASNFCVAADSLGLFAYDGSVWHTVGGSSDAVSCPTTTFCVATDQRGEYSAFDGTTWTAPTSIDPNTILVSVSCASSTFCVAVTIRGDYLVFDGNTWTAPAPFDAEAATLNSSGLPQLAVTGVSCPTTTFCAAVDSAGQAFFFSGSTWTPPTPVTNYLSSVSCPSAGHCMAAQASGVWQYKSGTWSESQNFSGPGSSPSPAAVSCPSDDFCTVVSLQGFTAVYESGRWDVVLLDQYPSSETDLQAVSCHAAGSCIAAAGNGWVYGYEGYDPPHATTITLTSSANPVEAGHGATFTATVQAPVPYSGFIQWSINGSPYSGCPLIQVTPATHTTSCAIGFSNAGSTAVTATYSGDAAYQASSATVSETVQSPPAPPPPPPTCSTKAGPSLPNAVGIAAVNVAGCPGYYVVDSFGQVSAFGSAIDHGGIDSSNARVVGIVAKPDSTGYWLVSADGQIRAFGTAGYYGSAANLSLTKPVLGMAVTQDAKGYWLVAQDGGIFSYGDAKFSGSMGGRHLNQPVDGMAVAPGGHGYWLVASDGGVFTFTSDGFYGSLAGHALNKPVIGMAGTSDGQGYTLVASDGGVFNYGDSPFYGSLGSNPPSTPVVDLTPCPANNGYYLVDAGGQVFARGPGAKYLGSV